MTKLLYFVSIFTTTLTCCLVLSIHMTMLDSIQRVHKHVSINSQHHISPKNTHTPVQGTSRFLAQGGGRCPPLASPRGGGGGGGGGHFEVKDGHPDFLQIT